MDHSASAGTPALTRGTSVLLSVATGVVIANLYFAQPLENALAETMRVGPDDVGLVLTLFQIGYALGLATVVPLGDLVERRRLLIVLIALCVLGLTGLAVAPGLVVLEVAAVLVGITSVVAQIIVPLAAHLAAPEEQGRAVGVVMSGLLIGILLSRTVAGLLASALGWRSVFAAGAVATVIIGILLHRSLPRVAPTTTLTYPKLLASVVTLVREEPTLRSRMALGALVFASFSTFWSSIGFLLASPPYEWNEAAIGAFALLGVAGAVVAKPAGRLSDKGHAQPATGIFLGLIAISFGVLWPGGHDVVALVIGCAMLDLGCQGAHLANQSVVYRLRPGAHSRINTAYMTSYFAGGTLGSGLSAVLVYPRFGWRGVCLLGASFAGLGFLVWGAGRLRKRFS